MTTVSLVIGYIPKRCLQSSLRVYLCVLIRTQNHADSLLINKKDYVGLQVKSLTLMLRYDKYAKESPRLKKIYINEYDINGR